MKHENRLLLRNGVTYLCKWYVMVYHIKTLQLHKCVTCILPAQQHVSYTTSDYQHPHNHRHYHHGHKALESLVPYNDITIEVHGLD